MIFLSFSPFSFSLSFFDRGEKVEEVPVDEKLFLFSFFILISLLDHPTEFRHPQMGQIPSLDNGLSLNKQRTECLNQGNPESPVGRGDGDRTFITHPRRLPFV